MQAALRTRRALIPDQSDQDHVDLLTTLDTESASLDDAIKGLNLLKEWHAKPGDIKEYVQKAGERWPKATVFQIKG